MTSPSPNPNYAANYALLTQYISGIVVRTANQSAQVLTDAAKKFDTGKHTVDDCYQTMTTLAGISLLGWTEAATSWLAGLGFPDLASAAYSGRYAVPGDVAHGHSVALLGALTRSVSDDVILPALVAFEARSADGTTALCPGGLLPAGTTDFRLLVNRTGMHSGCYVGKAQIIQLAGTTGIGGAPAVQLDVEIEL